MESKSGLERLLKKPFLEANRAKVKRNKWKVSASSNISWKSPNLNWSIQTLLNWLKTMYFISKETCWNHRSKKQCRMVSLKGLCSKPFWSQLCCKTCRPKGTCSNVWSNKKCGMLAHHCNRNRTVRKKCQAACKRC